MLKAIIMDFDGLVVDTEVVWYRIYAKWFEEHADYELTVQEFLSCVGADSDPLFSRLAKKGIEIDAEAFSRDTLELFKKRSALLPAKEGVEKLLKEAKENGLGTALATSAGITKIRYHLGRLDLLRYFDVLVTSEDVKNIKPAPDLFLAAAEKLGCSPAECLVVEDSRNGLLAGLNAEMKVLIVPNEVTKYSDFEGKYLYFDSLGEVDVPELIKNFPE